MPTSVAGGEETEPRRAMPCAEVAEPGRPVLLAGVAEPRLHKS